MKVATKSINKRKKHRTHFIEDDYWPYITGLNNDVFIKWPENVINPDGTNSSIMLGYVIF
jgi:hypothetical protein